MDMRGFFYQLDQLFEAKELEQAESFMKDSLSAAEKEKDLGAVISICNELGGYYRAVSRYREGILLYEKALRCIANLGLEGTEHHGTTLINFATTYTMIGESEKALRLYMQAADIFSNVGLDTDYRLATLFNNMSFLCEDLGELDSAAEYLNRALYILNALEESQIEIAITYTNLANIYLEQDQLNEAKVTVKKALDIFIKETEGLDVHYSAAVCALGEIYYKENNYEKAVSLFEKALELTKRDYGDSTLSCAILLENIAQCEQNMDMQQEANLHKEQALQIREKINI